MIQAKAELYNAYVAEWHAYGGGDERHRRLLKDARADLEIMCYRWFGLSTDAVCVPPASSVSNSGTGAVPVALNRDRLDTELPLRVFGDSAIHMFGRQPLCARRLVQRRHRRQRRQYLLERHEHRHREGVRRRWRQRGRHFQQLHRVPAHGGP